MHLKDALFVIEDVKGFYPSIPHQAEHKALR